MGWLVKKVFSQLTTPSLLARSVANRASPWITFISRVLRRGGGSTSGAASMRLWATARSSDTSSCFAHSIAVERRHDALRRVWPFFLERVEIKRCLSRRLTALSAQSIDGLVVHNRHEQRGQLPASGVYPFRLPPDSHECLLNDVLR